MPLPSEMLDQILIRLPVKHLLRCRCVCKGWCSLIDSAPFIKQHLKTTIEYSAGGGSLVINGADGKFYLADFMAMDGGDDDATAVQIGDPLRTPLSGASIVGASNGLVCVHKNMMSELLIFNPATRESRKIPSTPHEFPRSFHWNESSLCGFGYDHLNDDYKVVKIAECYLQFRGVMVIVYSLKTNCWKRIHNVPSNTRFTRDMGVFAGGALHWLAFKNPPEGTDIIVAFDLGLEQFKEILIPAMVGPVVSFSTRCVVSDGESLCILDKYPDSRTDVWLMNNSGAENPWSKPFSNHGILGTFRSFQPVHFFRSGESVLLEVDSAKLLWYDLGRKMVKNVMIHGIPDRFHSYVYTESLFKLKLLQKLSQDKPEKPSQDKADIKRKKRRDDFLSKGFKLRL